VRVALTVAGSDSGGGAGIQADIKSMQANGVFAASVITAVTAQNTRAVTAVHEIPVDIIAAQLDAVLSDIAVHAVKTGMLSSAEIITVVAEKLRAVSAPIVVDPVMISTSGFALLRPEAVGVLVERLLPLAALATPNAHEAAALTGITVDCVAAARAAAAAIFEMGPGAVLVKGGHLGEGDEVTDVLYDGHVFVEFSAPWLDTPHTHGTGCTLASAIAASLARGFGLEESVQRGRWYISGAIGAGLAIGGGHGPTGHFYFLDGTGLFPADS
jgi:hydroxymethylpyrimidine/phosphomethylpyrimidine kinase